MKIGIDAKWFYKGNPSGRIVVLNLVKEILSLDQDNTYYIFLRKQDAGKDFPHKYKNVHLVYIWSGNNLLSNCLVTPYYSLKFKIDVFLYQYFGPLIKFSKVVVLIHDVIFESSPKYFSLKERIYFKPMRWLAQRADKIVTISANEKRRLIKYKYGTEEKIQVIHLGVSKNYSNSSSWSNLQKAKLIQKYGLPDSFVLYVGRLNYRKNIHNLIKSFEYTNDDKLKLILAGSYDWKMFDVKSFIAEHNLQNRVQLLGFVDDVDLPLLYHLSKIFCFISFDEGFGLPPLEAMASGKPVIVANKGSLPEVCGSAGIYVDPNNPKQIGEAITKLISSPTRIIEMSAKGLKQASNFSWKKTGEEFLKMFKYVSEKE